MMRIEVTPKEALLAKFRNSLTFLKQSEAEAAGDVDIDRDWQAETVRSQFEDAYKTLMADIDALSKEMICRKK